MAANQSETQQLLATVFADVALVVLDDPRRFSRSTSDMGLGLPANHVETLQAVAWAWGVWRAWFIALTMRTGAGFVQKRQRTVLDEPARQVITERAIHYLKDQKLAVKYVKEQTIWLSAKLLGQADGDLPTFSEPCAEEKRGILGGGWVYRRCQTLLKHYVLADTDTNSTRLHKLGLALDILFSKTGRPAVSEDLVAQALEAYRHDMTVEHVEPDAAHGDGIRSQIKDRIREIVHRVFEGKRLDYGDQIPSLNASFESAQKWGGSFGGLLAAWSSQERKLYPEQKGLDLSDQALGGPLDDVVDLPVPTEYLNSQYIERVRGRGRGNILSGYVTVPVKGLSYLQSFNEFVDTQVWKIIEEGSIKVRPCLIKEPDKVRPITIQEGAATLRCMEMQKLMHRCLKACPPFEFIGKPLDREGWLRHFRHTVLGPDDFFQSGDYEGATNNLNPRLSEFTWDCICEEVTDVDGLPLTGSVWHALGRLDLTGHMFHFKNYDPLRQVWGQLMGSPTSFPVLCIINLAASSLGLGLSTDECFKVDSQILVNGDDLAAICPGSRYDVWKDYVGSAGLKPSLGKNYMSRVFGIMNSECFCHCKSVTEGKFVWVHVGALNQALLRGFEKKGLYAGDDLKPNMGWWELGSRARELVAGMNRTTAMRVMEFFIREHSAVLAAVPSGISWYTSEALGGLGFPFGDPTVDERQVASYFACMGERRRARLLRYPKKLAKGWVDQTLADSEWYYRQFFRTELQDRDPWDLVLESWQIPISREKSDIGSSLRLAYCLNAWVLYWSQLPSSVRVGLVGPALEKRASCFTLGSYSTDVEFQKEVLVTRQRFDFHIKRAHYFVSRWNDDDTLPEPEDIVRGFFEPKHRDQYMFNREVYVQKPMKLIRLEKSKAWVPPQETVVIYPHIISIVPTRFGQASQRSMRSASHPVLTSQPCGHDQDLFRRAVLRTLRTALRPKLHVLYPDLREDSLLEPLAVDVVETPRLGVPSLRCCGAECHQRVLLGLSTDYRTGEPQSVTAGLILASLAFA
jgi:hypothetical protein